MSQAGHLAEASELREALDLVRLVEAKLRTAGAPALAAMAGHLAGQVELKVVEKHKRRHL